MFDKIGRFIIEDYQTKPTFASFLPGISGKNGIPIWSFYVNRGQGICSFGSEDKEHSIMEFYPAAQAYQNTPLLGFRTFIKLKGEFYEPFKEAGSGKTKMFIGMNELEIEEVNKELGIQVNVLYYTLPGETLGELVRKITVTSLSSEDVEIEILDGMPALIPQGVSLTNMKEMAQTVKAWMMVENRETGLPYFKVRASIKDSTVVTKSEAGHFYLAVEEEGGLLPVIVDPDLIFEYETSLQKPIGFLKHSLDNMLSGKQATENNLPCAFLGKSMLLKAKDSYSLYSLIGKAHTKEALVLLKGKCTQKGYFHKKQEECNELIRELCKRIETKTGSHVFDSYCKQTFLDNILRGGYPIVLGKDKVFYIYGRKHGDIERDYNFFSMVPEYYSQGNGNFRDINQNRRCDVQFMPFVKEKNIKMFYNLIQLDGYNPLLIQKVYFTIAAAEKERIQDKVTDQQKGKLGELLSGTFTPGSVAAFLSRENIMEGTQREELLNEIFDYTIEHQQAEFGEGYWTDHWTYNLDLIENYLEIYPDQEEELLWKDKTYTYYRSGVGIRPRKERYVLTERGIRQHNVVEEVKPDQKGNQEEYCSNLMTKLMVLAVNKYAALDPYGMGIEMEGGKPGWYDALNGLPGIFGSSMAETYELCRMNDFILKILNQHKIQVELPRILYEFMLKIESARVMNQGRREQERFFFWNQVNDAKESYREMLKKGSCIETVCVPAENIIGILNSWQEDLNAGVRLAIDYGGGICSTYFAYELKEYDETPEGIVPKRFSLICIPHFLEGPVRYLKLSESKEVKRDMYNKVKKSSLFDQKLQMYKVNESLEKASYEIGRAKAFTPGWLENESIWLHMEYKYLLELLKSGLYEEFFDDFHKAAVPFLDPEVYGRSVLENSSFIVSSANPNEKLHGRGFVARLSGSTIEFLSMWQIMMFGRQPFVVSESGLELSFHPAVPKYLIGEEKKIQAVFLGSISVSYHLGGKRNLIPGCYQITSYTLTYRDGTSKVISGGSVIGEPAYEVRKNKITKIEVEFES